MEPNLDLDRDIPVLEWAPHLAVRTKGMKNSAIRELLKLTQVPDLISMAGGMPAPELFPLREIEEACRHICRENGARALQYGATVHLTARPEHLHRFDAKGLRIE